jgi:hypothetical protein
MKITIPTILTCQIPYQTTAGSATSIFFFFFFFKLASFFVRDSWVTVSLLLSGQDALFIPNARNGHTVPTILRNSTSVHLFNARGKYLLIPIF